MNYKGMILIALLLPVLCHSQTKADRIKELEDRQWEKVLEVKELERKITNSHEFIGYFRHNYIEQMDYAAKRKLRASKDSTSDEEQKKNIRNENNVITKRLHRAIYGKDTFDYDLTKELFADELDGREELDDFCTLKFFFLQITTERLVLKHLVASYQKRLGELCAIGQELATLKQGG